MADGGLTSIMPILSLGGGLVQGLMGSNAASVNAQNQANAMSYNAQVAANNAQAATNAAAANAQQQQTINNANMGKMVAAAAANGADVSSGTPVMLFSNEAAQNSLAVQNITYQGQVQSASYTNQAQLDSANAAAAITAGNYQGTGSLISGINTGVAGYARLSGQNTALTSSYDSLIGNGS